MANFYRECKIAGHLIERLVSEREEIFIAAITYKICNEFGFRSNFVMKRLKLMEQVGKVRLTKDKVYRLENDNCS